MPFTNAIECPDLTELSSGEYSVLPTKAFSDAVECPWLIDVATQYASLSVKAFSDGVECPWLIEIAQQYAALGVKAFTPGAVIFVSVRPVIPGDDSFEIIVGLYLDFDAIPRQGREPLRVQFRNLSSEYFTQWLWNFGDGDSDIALDPVHVYKRVGSYDVELRAKLYPDWYVEKKRR